MARSIRDVLAQRWLLTERTYDHQNPKEVYYLSMEFLIGRTMANAITNLQIEEFVHNDFASDVGQDWQALFEDRAGCRAGQRRAGPAGGLFSRLAGHAADSRRRLRPALRIRNVPPGDQGRPPGRASGQLADPTATPGRSFGRTRRSRSGSTALSR